MDSVWSQFAREGHFHGLRELADSRKSRQFWLFIGISAASGLAWQLEAVFERFFKQQTGTLIENRMPDMFPSVTICPTNYLGSTAAEKFNVSKEVFDIWEGFLPFGVYFDAVLREEEMPRPKPEDMEAAVEILKTKFENNLTLALLSVTPETNEVFQIIKFIPYPIKFHVSKLINWVGLCFAIESTQKLPYLMQTYGELHIVMNKSAERITGVAVIPGGREMSAVNPSVHDVFPMGYDYNIRLSTKWLERVDIRRNPCKGENYEDWHNSQFHRCKLDYFNNNECTDICKTFVPTASTSGKNQYTGTIFELCNAFNRTLFDCINEVMRREELNSSSRQNHCKEPCYQRLHDLLILPYYPSNSTKFRISLAKLDLAIAVKEYRTFSIDTLISNIGGTVSLWFGASMISFVNLALFILNFPYRYYKSRRELQVSKGKGEQSKYTEDKKKRRQPKVATKTRREKKLARQKIHLVF